MNAAARSLARVTKLRVRSNQYSFLMTMSTTNVVYGLLAAQPAARSPRQVQIKPLAPRPDTLAGKIIGLLWNYVFPGDEVFATMQ